MQPLQPGKCAPPQRWRIAFLVLKGFNYVHPFRDRGCLTRSSLFGSYTCIQIGIHGQCVDSHIRSHRDPGLSHMGTPGPA